MSRVPRVGVAVIIARDGQVLLVRRRDVHGAGSWSTPGGHLEFGESPEQCAVRETKEETGIDVGDISFRALTNDLFEAEGRHYITLWMEARYLAGEPTVGAPQEMSDVSWFALDALPRPLFLPLKNLLHGRCYPPTGRPEWGVGEDSFEVSDQGNPLTEGESA